MITEVARSIRAALRPRVDGPMFFAVVALVALGVVMVGASAGPASMALASDPFFYLKRQIIFALLGFGALTVGAALDPGALRRRALPIAIVTLLLLVIVLVPGIGHMAGGARRWLQIGSFGIQVGEIAKLAVVIMLAASLAKRRGDRAIVSHMAFPCVAAALLLAEPDFGTAVLIMTITFVMLFVGGARIGVLAGIALLALPASVIAISTSAYRMRRVLAFLDPWAHRYDIGYQVTESLMTIGSGGALGVGLGESKQKLFFLPAAHTDFIFAVIGEELGFIGAMFVLSMFAVIGARALKASLVSKDSFVSLLVLGLASLLIVQATLNIAVVLGLVPTKGITLPFVSAGGSSLLVSLFIAGLLMRATQDALHTNPNRRSAMPLRAGVILRGAET